MNFETMKVDMFDERKLENQAFANLMDSASWDLLKRRFEEPGNTKTLDELLKDLMEGR